MEVRIKIFTLFFLANLLSVVWAVNWLVALEHVFWLLLAFGTAWLISNSKEKIKLVYALVAGLMFSTWLGIWQFFVQFAFANKWLGLAAHDPTSPGTSIVEIYGKNGLPIRWLRAYGSFDHPNIFGVVMAVAILLVMWLLTRDKNKGTEKVFLFFALCSFSAGLFASLSRSAWAGLLLALIAVLIKISKNELRNKFRDLSKPIFAAFFVFILLISIYPAQFMMRSGGEGRLEQKSFNERALYFEQGKKMIAKNWFLGVGTGNYVEALKNENQNNPVWAYQPVHNVFLLIWAETGIIGILLSIILLILMLRKAWQSGSFALGLSLVVLPSMIVDHWFWSLHVGLLLAGLIVGLIFKSNTINIAGNKK